MSPARKSSPPKSAAPTQHRAPGKPQGRPGKPVATAPHGPKIAVFTGSFDPITLGHLDLISRAAGLFDEVHVAVGVARGKDTWFSPKERVDMIHECLHGLSNVVAASFEGLAVNYATRIGAVALVRGIRSATDYTYEMTMAMMNRAMCPGLETLLLPTHPQYSHVSSSLAKEIAACGGDAGLLVPASVVPHLLAKAKKRQT